MRGSHIQGLSGLYNNDYMEESLPYKIDKAKIQYLDGILHLELAYNINYISINVSVLGVIIFRIKFLWYVIVIIIIISVVNIA